jgi:hypothetical protein
MQITLKYDATCRDCGKALPAGTKARWYRNGATYCLDGHNGKANGKRETTSVDFEAIYQKAEQAGLEAGKNAVPTPMVVQQHQKMFDDRSPVVKSYHVSEGVCGFAWVKVRPGTHAFARWLRKQGLGDSDSYAGGTTIWISAHGQSYERKRAHAVAMAKVLNQIDGLEAYAQSRLD